LEKLESENMENLENMDEIVLQKIRFGVSQNFTKEFLDNLKFNKEYDVVTQELRTQLKWWALGKSITKTVVNTVKYPTTWKDAVKERFYPNFLKKRFPVNYTYSDVEITHYHICPHINVPSQATHIHFCNGKEP
jgi:hypothetical protein